ncbi:MAG: hypothetical protein C4325_05620 [Blastocatellia bacterium]
MEPIEIPASESKSNVRFQDEFQAKVGSFFEQIGKKIEGKGKNIAYGVAAAVVLVILIGIFYSWSNRSNAAAQAALGKAIEISNAPISDTPPPAGSNQRTFKTEKERAEAAIAEFQKVVDNYGGSVGEKAKYFIAINRLSIDRPAGIAELQTLAKGRGETATLAKFALGQALAADGKLDEAAALYSELASSSDPILAKETINFELAKVYERQGKTSEAGNVLFELVKAAVEAKDSEGKPVPLSPTAEEAKAKLEMLDPAKAKELPQSAGTGDLGLSLNQ